MLENLNYIYLAMYAIDIYNSIVLCLELTSLFLIVWALTWIIGFCTCIDSCEDNVVRNTVHSIWKHTKVYQIITYIIVVLSWVVLAIIPSENTVKAYIGVKTTQAVGTYLNDSTEIPTHCRKTINNLWKKVDDYIETINVDNAVSNTLDSTTAEIKQLKDKAGNDAVDAVLNQVRQHTIDSLNAIK